MVCISHASDKDGYIRPNIGRKRHYLHRVIYELHNGHVPEGMCVCHSCDNPACCNPEHLFVGSPQDNVDDKVRKNRQAKGENHGLSKLTEDQIHEIRSRIPFETLKEIGDSYGVSYSIISQIKRNIVWKHVEPIESNRTSHLPVPDDGDSINHQPHTTGREPYCVPVQLTFDFLQ